MASTVRQYLTQSSHKMKLIYCLVRGAMRCLFALLIISIELLVVSASSLAFSTGGENAAQLLDLKSHKVPDDYSSLVIELSSPKCWKAAVNILSGGSNIHHGHRRALLLCASMTEEQQMLLALEIARCHLDDLGKPLFEITATTACAKPAQDESTLRRCLKQLSDAGMQAYTIFRSDIAKFCPRLTAEMFVQFQSDSTVAVLKQYEQLVAQTQTQMQNIQSQSVQLSERLMALPNMLTNQLTGAVVNQLIETVNETLAGLLEIQLSQVQESLLGMVVTLMQSMASKHEIELKRIMDDVDLREQGSREQLLIWSQLFQKKWENQMIEMDRQHALEMDNFAKSITETTVKMQPFFALEAWVTAATTVYTYAAFALYFFVTIHFVWLFTRPVRCQESRPALYVLVMVEAAGEVALMAMAQRQILTTSECSALSVELRRWAFVFQCGTLVLGFLASFLWRQPLLPREDSEEDLHKSERKFCADAPGVRSSVIHDHDRDLRATATAPLHNVEPRDIPFDFGNVEFRERKTRQESPERCWQQASGRLVEITCPFPNLDQRDNASRRDRISGRRYEHQNYSTPTRSLRPQEAQAAQKDSAVPNDTAGQIIGGGEDLHDGGKEVLNQTLLVARDDHAENVTVSVSGAAHAHHAHAQNDFANGENPTQTQTQTILNLQQHNRTKTKTTTKIRTHRHRLRQANANPDHEMLPSRKRDHDIIDSDSDLGSHSQGNTSETTSLGSTGKLDVDVDAPRKKMQRLQENTKKI